MSEIFISYRREDSADVTGRINDHLIREFGEEAIFTDVDNIPLGVDFRRHIDDKVSQCSVLIAVIGADWLSVTNEQGQRRLDDPADFVRLEIESALERDIPLIPVLVRRAGMPKTDRLPKSIQALAFRNATPVRPDPDFRNDVRRLIQGIMTHLADAPLKSSAEQKSTASQQSFSRESTELQPGAVFRDRLAAGDEGPAMVVIPSGTYKMGSPETEIGRYKHEGPQHQVSIHAFALGQTPVTFDDYDRSVEDTGREKPEDEGWGRGRRPVINVSWQDAIAYAEWLSVQTGKTYRLPSEAEWEYAARAGSTTRYSWGDEIDCSRARYGYYEGDCGNQRSTNPVCTYPDNAFGLFDMHGNVFEWVQDCRHKSYRGAPADGRAWLREGPLFNRGDNTRRVLRGGSWFFGPEFQRSASRDWNRPGGRYFNVGFRLARNL